MATTSYNIYQQLTSVRLASPSNLVGNYFNGSLNNGVGATLTAASVGALFVDGIAVDVGDRLLLFSQTNANENGIYQVNAKGGPISLWQIERSADFQSIEQLKVGQYFSVGAGNTLSGVMFVLVEPLPEQIGTGLGTFHFNNVSSGGGGGPFLTVAANLGDLSSLNQASENIGMGEGTAVTLTEADFPGGQHILTNPCPNQITVNCTIPGSYALILPPAQGAKAFQLFQGPVVANIGTQTLNVFASGGPFQPNIQPGQVFHILLTDNSTLSGLWEYQGVVYSVNGMTGDVVLPAPGGEIVYVSSNGVDQIGSGGTILNPYQTISFALSQITDNSSSKPYTIYVETGVYTETNLLLKPNIAIVGNSSTLIVSGSTTLDPTWAAASGFTIIQGFQNNTILNINLDFKSIIPAFSVVRLENIVTGSDNWVIDGADNPNTTILIVNQCFSFAGALNITKIDCYGGVAGGSPANLINRTTGSNGRNLNLTNNTILGNYTDEVLGAGSNNTTFTGNIVVGNISLRNPGGGSNNIVWTANKTLGTVTVDYPGVNVIPDVLGVNPSFTNGATLSQIQINSKSNSIIQDDFVPANYTPVSGATWLANSLSGNLKGIDNALSLGGGSTIEFIYIAPTGNDLTGTGKINAPFLTYEKARTYAQSLTPSPSNQFLIYAAPGQYLGMTDLIYDPWVHLYGQDAYFQGSGSIVQDSFIWGNNNNQSFAMIGPNLVLDFAGSLDFDMTGVTPRNNVFILQGIRYINITGFTAKGVGTSTWYVKDVRPMSVTQSGSNPPFVDFTFQDCYGEISDSTVNNLQYNLSSFEFESESLPFQVKDCTIHGNYSSTGVSGIKTANIELTGNAIYGTISASGSDITINSDSGSVWSVPSLSSGATFNLRSLGDGVLANFSPVHYTPVDPSVTGNLKGIDNALATAGGTIAYGEMFFESNATLTTFSAPATPVKVNATYVTGLLAEFSQLGGTLTYTGMSSRTILVNCELTATYPATAQNTSFYIAHNGAIVPKSEQTTYIGAVTPANQSNPVAALIHVSTGDTIEIWVANNDNTNSINVVDMNCSIVAAGGNATIPGNMIAQQLWVNSASGNDSNNGDIDSPFASYEAARLHAVSLASPTNPYLINIIGNQSITGDFTVSPYITVDGHNSGTITTTGDIVIDSSLLTLSNQTPIVQNCIFNIRTIDIEFDVGVNNFVFLLNCDFPSINPAYAALVSSNASNTQANGLVIVGKPSAFFPIGFSVLDAAAEFINLTMITPITVSSSGTAPTSLSLLNVSGANTISSSSSLGTSITIELANSQGQNVTLNDTLTNVFTDVLSLNSTNLTLLGGATASQITYNTDCSAQNVSTLLYISTNYSPTAPSPKVRSDSILSHLNGINLAIGSNPASNMNTNRVLGRYSAGTGPAQELNPAFGVSITPSGDIIWDYNYGNVSPGSLSANANVSSVTQTGAFYFEQTGSVSGAIVNGTIQFTFTSTSTLPSIRVPYPVLPGGLSVNAVNVTGNIKNSVTPTVSDGNVLGSTANPTYFTIEMVTAGSTTYVATVYYQYRLI